MSIKAILFDVGGVLLNEDAYYDSFFDITKQVVRECVCNVNDEEFASALSECIKSFVPSLGQSLVWHFTKPDIGRFESVLTEIRRRRAKWENTYAPRLVPSIDATLQLLQHKHVLALAGNAAPTVRGCLDKLGILNCFDHQTVSGDLSYGKPDPRFFEHILRECEVAPDEALMIGDRLDNDIVPARMLGMKTVWVRVGPYKILEPRVPSEIPDEVVGDVKELSSAIAAVTGMRS